MAHNYWICEFVLCGVFWVSRNNRNSVRLKKIEIPLNTLVIAVSERESSALPALTLGCLFGNLLPFPSWFRDSPYKFMTWHILCSLRSLCWEGFWLLLPACSSCLSSFPDDAASPWCYSVFSALGLKVMCSETWMSAVLCNWCSHSLPVWDTSPMFGSFVYPSLKVLNLFLIQKAGPLLKGISFTVLVTSRAANPCTDLRRSMLTHW